MGFLIRRAPAPVRALRPSAARPCSSNGTASLLSPHLLPHCSTYTQTHSDEIPPNATAPPTRYHRLPPSLSSDFISSSRVPFLPNFFQAAPFVQPSDQMQIISKIALIASFFSAVFTKLVGQFPVRSFFPPTLKKKQFERKVCHR